MSAPIRLDFSDVPDISTPVPAGEYMCNVDKAKVEKGPKAPYIVWELVIDSPPDCAGRKLWLNTSLSPKALWKVRDTLVALGETRENVRGAFSLDLEKYIGVTVLATVSIEKYQGVERNRVEYVEAVGEFTPRDFDEPAPRQSESPF